ncbi:hypothetical protein [Flavivirga algicola]|uniref:Transposase n=1 Tax=Flavivirga algicola TaxID=2729136 RepID=A0ABX1S2T0_9FLAO|nr:hypothetical protein [Flavivirga algicola]NMH89049.1 hypothetical protein [Flavivirga algicola]
MSLKTITACFGLKRNAYYKYKRRENKRLLIENKILNIVKRRRKPLPREGVRKPKISLKDDFDKANLKVDRDTLFKILRKHNMLILRKKYSSRTTNSMHRFYKYKTLLKRF